jgi:septal ring factor EnvC (AmiA/AmiB activator)
MTVKGLLQVSVIFLLLLGVGISSLFIRKKNRLLKQKKDEITATSAKMEILNEQLHLINDELKNTNQKRERLVKVYIDLSYKNIERNQKLRTLAVRKIKANQSKELLSLLSSSSSTERENKEFLTEFDKSFLALYPTFVNELNQQLTEHIFTSTKTRVNGLIYAKNPKLDKSSLPSITLTGE